MMEQEEEKKTLVSKTISISEDLISLIEEEMQSDRRSSFSDMICLLAEDGLAARKKAREDNKTD